MPVLITCARASRWSVQESAPLDTAANAQKPLTWTCGSTQPPTPQGSLFAPNHCTHEALEEGQDIGEVVVGVVVAESLRRVASARYSSPCSAIKVSRALPSRSARRVRKDFCFLVLRASQWSVPAACGNTSGLDSYRTLVALAKRNLRPTACSDSDVCILEARALVRHCLTHESCDAFARDVPVGASHQRS